MIRIIDERVKGTLVDIFMPGFGIATVCAIKKLTL